MHFRKITIFLCTCLFSSWTLAQPEDSYQVPRTEYGQADFQGVWSARFSTLMERPPGTPLVMPPEQAAEFAQMIVGGGDGNADPDIDNFGAPTLTRVNGEYRSAQVTSPEYGTLPYNELGMQRSSHSYFDGRGYDGPEQRPGVERCTEAWSNPPMSGFLFKLYHGIVQTADKIAIISEEVAAVRIIHMDGYQRPEAVTSFDGHSVGHWEGDTLVVEISHFSGVNPERAAMGRPVLISEKARVTERFTRLSETELNYQYTVNDPIYYTEPWSAEFSFVREDVNHIYEYGCHEGNRSMSGALAGARYQEAEAAKKAAQ
tara:strand:+ start:7619 stop:8566 length:948 start_codon:yes stop_codon:yes gene_type:complete